MTAILAFHTDRLHWSAAVVLALVVHGAALSALSFQVPEPPAPPPETQVIIDSIELASSTAVETVPQAQALRPSSVASAPDAAPERAQPVGAQSATATDQISVAGATQPETAAKPATDRIAAVPDDTPESTATSQSPAAAERIAGETVGASGARQRVGASGQPDQATSPNAPDQIGPSDPSASVEVSNAPTAPARVATAPVTAGQVTISQSANVGPASTAATAPSIAAEQSSQIQTGQRVGAQTTVVSSATRPATAQSTTDRPTTTPVAPVASPNAPAPSQADEGAQAAVQPQSQSAATTDPQANGAALVPERVTALRPTAEAVAPNRAEPSTASSSPQTGDGRTDPAPAPEGSTTAEDRARYAAILDHLKRYSGGSCFAALPALGDRAGQLTLDAFGETTKRLDRFRAGLEEAAGIVPGTYLKPVSTAQCATLSFIKQLPTYPEFGLYFEMAEREIKSGNRLVGRIRNTSGLFLHLLLIDDEGTVQSLDSFLKFRAGAAEFSIPMTYQGGPIDTQQLIMAVGSPGRLDTIEDLNGASAFAFFAALEGERAEKGLAVDLSMVAFSVQP